MIAHGATYGAQAQLLRALVGGRRDWDLVMGVRELDRVFYEDDPEGRRLRLRIRTDAILRPGGPGSSFPLAKVLIGPAVQANIDEASLSSLVGRLDPADGLKRPGLAAMLWRTATGGGAGQWSDRDVLLDQGDPLPSRLEWRGEQ